MADGVAPALLVDALRRRQHGQPLPPQLPFAIHDANVFAADPSALYNEYWSYAADDGSIYLFSPGLSTESQWRTATAARSITTAASAGGQPGRIVTGRVCKNYPPLS
uniref:NAC domain-containing protein n=1 Tax=Oryza punctata TaxID=4537 RepID=A0A0E0LR65_ORYPU